MNPAQQEQLFKDLLAAHPKWTKKFASGYVAGVIDEARHDQPVAAFVEDAAKDDAYSYGYLLAFAVHRGSDCEQEPWFHQITRLYPRDAR